jgi:hypothetical protein
MPEDQSKKPFREETPLARQVGTKAARKLKAQRHTTRNHLVWAGHDGAGRLVGCDSDTSRRGARSLVGQTLPRTAFMDAHAALHRPDHRLCECVALGDQGRQGNTSGTGESR